MEYVGAADYFFWDGVQKGFKGSLNNLPEYLHNKFTFKNNVTNVCIDAFKWGFCLGLILTQKEYNKLTIYTKEDKIKSAITKKINLSKIKPPSHIIGNC